jgi:quercetin dioxygenase-like cupin family protein
MSIIHQFIGDPAAQDYRWEGIQEEVISTNDVKGILKHVLVGPKDGAPTFIIRYFQVPAGEQTFFHTHDHEHGMLILHGQAQIQIKEEMTDLAPMDAIFVAGGDLHRVINTGDEPLGFICVIPKLVPNFQEPHHSSKG